MSEWGGKRDGAGRPKDAKNKRTEAIIDEIQKIMDALNETFYDDLKKLKPAERARMKLDLLEYQAPKLARTETKIEGDVEFRHVDYKEKTDD